ncbi:MAG TPA: DUF488 family protein [Myxococcales bacterium]|jgi:uncharacterized protein YeaO (DUF488 family)
MPRKTRKVEGQPLSTKRVYEAPSHQDGARFLVERLWPRGLRKEALEARGWLKEAAPSDALRRWFHHDPSRWTEFERRYFEELDRHPKAVEPLREASREGPVTLLYSSRDREHNAAAALREYLEATGGR